MTATQRREAAGGIVQWPIPDDLLNDQMVTQAESLTLKYARAELGTILDVYVAYDDARSVERDFANLFEALQPFEFHGRGMEIGAGIAIFSAMLCRHFPGVEKVYAIEVVNGVVEHLRPVVTRHFLPDAPERVVDVVGSFDDIMLEDGSCDFCVENSSLHHSHDLDRTLEEINRKLKMGGHLLIVDRAHSDALSGRQRRRMLDVVYSKEVMEKNGFTGERLTRRENGEHEIRLCEWKGAIAAAGFEIARHRELRLTGWDRLARALVLSIPYPIRELLDIMPTRVRPHPGEIAWRLRCLTGGGGRDRKFKRGFRDYSVFLAKKVADVSGR